jgi:hypothetical protein
LVGRFTSLRWLVIYGINKWGSGQLTVLLLFFIAITAAMKNVLSPISESKIIPQDFRKPCKTCRNSSAMDEMMTHVHVRSISSL